MEQPMDTTNQPSKERIRDWILNRQLEPKPLPDMERIKIEIGWNVDLINRSHNHLPLHNKKD
jgi:hypothetical protein